MLRYITAELQVISDDFSSSAVKFFCLFGYVFTYVMFLVLCN